jgi:hypothetical protein
MRSYLQLTDAKTSVPFRMMTFPAYRTLRDFNSSNTGSQLDIEIDFFYINVNNVYGLDIRY